MSEIGCAVFKLEVCVGQSCEVSHTLTLELKHLVDTVVNYRVVLGKLKRQLIKRNYNIVNGIQRLALCTIGGSLTGKILFIFALEYSVRPTYIMYKKNSQNHYTEEDRISGYEVKQIHSDLTIRRNIMFNMNNKNKKLIARIIVILLVLAMVGTMLVSLFAY